MTQVPHTTPGPVSHLQPHRGTLILVFSILSWVLCVIFGIVAWVMANNDLEKMRAGQMDPSGEGLTNAGRIVAMVSCILAIVGIVVGVIFIVVAIIGAAASTATGG